jgi:hypothetical protein
VGRKGLRFRVQSWTEAVGKPGAEVARLIRRTGRWTSDGTVDTW